MDSSSTPVVLGASSSKYDGLRSSVPDMLDPAKLIVRTRFEVRIIKRDTWRQEVLLISSSFYRQESCFMSSIFHGQKLFHAIHFGFIVAQLLPKRNFVT